MVAPAGPVPTTSTSVLKAVSASRGAEGTVGDGWESLRLGTRRSPVRSLGRFEG